MTDTNTKIPIESLFTSPPPNFGPINSAFLRRSIGVLLKREPMAVTDETLVYDALAMLRKERIGCLLVKSKDDSLVGIFTERDCVLKVVQGYCDGTANEPISKYMTPNPITVDPDAPIAYALNLMSHGGFRHLPVVSQGVVLGLLSVKDLLDELVREMVGSFDVVP